MSSIQNQETNNQQRDLKYNLFSENQNQLDLSFIRSDGSIDRKKMVGKPEQFINVFVKNKGLQFEQKIEVKTIEYSKIHKVSNRIDRSLKGEEQNLLILKQNEEIINNIQDFPKSFVQSILPKQQYTKDNQENSRNIILNKQQINQEIKTIQERIERNKNKTSQSIDYKILNNFSNIEQQRSRIASLITNRTGNKSPLFLRSEQEFRVLQEKKDMLDIIEKTSCLIKKEQDWISNLRIYNTEPDIANFTFISKENKKDKHFKPKRLPSQLRAYINQPLIIKNNYSSIKSKEYEQELESLFRRSNLHLPKIENDSILGKSKFELERRSLEDGNSFIKVSNE